VHVERDANRAKFSIPDGWPRVAASAELRSAVEALVRDNAVQRRRAWDEHFTE